MKNLMTNKNVGVLVLFIAVAMIMTMIPELAMAQSNVGTILGNSRFKTIIKFGLGMYAAWQWFSYFNNFSPSSAFKDVIVPAIITYLAFEWETVLGFFNITSL